MKTPAVSQAQSKLITPEVKELIADDEEARFRAESLVSTDVSDNKSKATTGFGLVGVSNLACSNIHAKIHKYVIGSGLPFETEENLNASPKQLAIVNINHQSQNSNAISKCSSQSNPDCSGKLCKAFGYCQPVTTTELNHHPCTHCGIEASLMV